MKVTKNKKYGAAGSDKFKLGWAALLVDLKDHLLGSDNVVGGCMGPI